MPAHEELLALIPAYALGALDGDDLRELEEHLEGGCETCERELLESTRQVEALAETVEPQAPSELLKARLDRELDRREGVEVRSSSKRGWQVAAALLLAVVSWSLWERAKLQRANMQLESDRASALSQLASVQEQLDETRVALTRLARAGRIVAAPDTRAVLLASLEAGANARAQTYVDPATRSAVFYASNLAPLEKDRTYQLWFIADGTPVSAGVFLAETNGTATVLVDDTAAIDDIQLWAVTIEPAGGVPQPTGPMVLKS